MAIIEIFIARQPIFDTQLNVIAYELLYRKSDQNFYDGSLSANVATSILLMNSHLTFGLKNLVGEEKAFINFDRHLIEADIPLLLNKDAIVVELLEDIIPNDYFIGKLRNLKEAGYTIALDDYTEGYDFDALVDLSDIIKVDFFENNQDQLAQIAVKYKRRGKKLLAEKVETKAMFEWAKSVGYDYFQGYFFAKPTMIKGKKMDDHAYQYVQLLDALSISEPDVKSIAKIIERDVQLTYKLLKLVNSAYSLNQEIRSILHALNILGIYAFQRWLSLAMVENFASNAPNELVKTALIRSEFMGNLARLCNEKKQDEITLIGTLSVLDVLLGQPMATLLEPLSLSDNIKNTLLHRPSPYNELYELVLAYEKGAFEHLPSYCDTMHFDLGLIPGAYYKAVARAEDLFHNMS